MKRYLFAGLVTAFALTMSVDAEPQEGEPLDDPIPRPVRIGGVAVALEPVTDGLTAPNWGTFAPGLDDRLFVTDQDGILWNIDLDAGDRTVFLDVSGRLVALGVAGPNSFDERGLLGVAFHPEYLVNGLLYTYTSEPVEGPPDFSTIPPDATANHQSVLAEWQVLSPADPSAVVEPSTRRELLRIDQPQFNHNAGALNFGPDEMLYISLGDGGSADDQGTGHAPQGNAQDTSNILGTIIRIDPSGSNSANGQYGIPADNPFVGEPGIVREIFAFGFRNPFRFSFDMETGDIYIGDAGQNDIEEVDVVVAGGNYGWRIREGSFCFQPGEPEDAGEAATDGFVTAERDCGPADLINPVAEYDHDEGIAVIGGFVYRGEAIPGLRGRYVFGDFSRAFFGSNGRLFFLNKRDIVKGDRVKTSKIEELQLVDRSELGAALLGLGQDARGELYFMANATSVPFGDSGIVYKIVPASH